MSDEKIRLDVKEASGSVVGFRTKKVFSLSLLQNCHVQDKRLGKLMNRYCDMKGLQISMVRFRFGGKPVKETETPREHGMKDGDIIDVFQQECSLCTLCTNHHDLCQKVFDSFSGAQVEERSEEPTVDPNQVDMRG